MSHVDAPLSIPEPLKRWRRRMSTACGVAPGRRPGNRMIVPCLRERAMEPLQNVFGNAHGCPLGGFPHRIPRKMRIARGGLDSAVTEQP